MNSEPQKVASLLLMSGQSIINNERGQIALISLLIILAVVLTIGLSVNLLSIGEMKMGFTESESSKTFYSADACIEEALMRLKRDPDYNGGNLNVDNIYCIITITANGNQRVITSEGIVGNKVRKIEMVINFVGRKMEVVSWKELP